MEPKKCGGKVGNQAVSAAKAGARAIMIGAVGYDDFGSHLVSNLQAKNVETALVRTEPGAKSGMSLAIFDADNDHGAVIVSGSNLTLGVDAVARAEPVASKTEILVLQKRSSRGGQPRGSVKIQTTRRKGSAERSACSAPEP